MQVMSKLQNMIVDFKSLSDLTLADIADRFEEAAKELRVAHDEMNKDA